MEEDPGIGLTVRLFLLSPFSLLSFIIYLTRERKQVFTGDEPGILSLPRDTITSFLSSIDRGACEGYLEYIIWTLGEEGGAFHDKLAELYMVDSRVHREEKEKEEEKEQGEPYTKLLEFLNDSIHYRPYRLMNKLSGQGTSLFLLVILIVITIITRLID